MSEKYIETIVLQSHKYNLDQLIETLINLDPINVRKHLIRLYMFAANAAIHKDYLREEDAHAIDFLQMIIESMESIENKKDAILTIRMK